METFFIQKLFLQCDVQNFSHSTNKPLPASSVARTCWRIEVPLDTLLLQGFCDLAGVPFFDRFLQLTVSRPEVASII